MSTRPSVTGDRLDRAPGGDDADDSYGESNGSVMELTGFDLAAFDSDAAADEVDRPQPAPAPRQRAAPASVHAAADLLDSLRDEEEDDWDDTFEDDDVLADAPLPPRRRRKRQASPEVPPAPRVNPNVLVLASVLAVPAVLLSLNLAFGEHQSTRAEWRDAFDELDDLMNEFVDVAQAPESEWAAWKVKFETARPELRYKVEAAPDASAGGAVDRAVNTLEQAVALRTDGAPPDLMNKTVRRAVDHAQEAAGRLGLTKREWAK